MTEVIARVHSVHLVNVEQLPTLRPSHLTWAVSPPVGSYRLQQPSPFLVQTTVSKFWRQTFNKLQFAWNKKKPYDNLHVAIFK